MSKRDELAAKYKADLEGLGIKVKEALLDDCIQACGPSIYNADSELVASSDPAELATVRNGFVAKHLGITDEGKANAAIDAVVERYGRSNRNKYRAVFYYLLKEHVA